MVDIMGLLVDTYSNTCAGLDIMSKLDCTITSFGYSFKARKWNI